MTLWLTRDQGRQKWSGQAWPKVKSITFSVILPVLGRNNCEGTMTDSDILFLWLPPSSSDKHIHRHESLSVITCKRSRKLGRTSVDNNAVSRWAFKLDQPYHSSRVSVASVSRMSSFVDHFGARCERNSRIEASHIVGRFVPKVHLLLHN